MRKIYLLIVIALAHSAQGQAPKASSADIQRFEKLLTQVTTGCRAIWPDSERLRKACVDGELDMFNLALEKRLIDVAAYLKTGVIRDAK